MFCCHCYTRCADGSQKYCGNCRRGVYCSRECQGLDWRSGHKKWCGVVYGIGGKDWDSMAVSGTKGGIGCKVIALRRFERDDRIMIERLLKPEDIMADDRLKSAVEPLEPNDQNVYALRRTADSSQEMMDALAIFGDRHDLKVKYARNAVGSHDSRGDFGGICVEMSKIQHACEPNAATYLDVETMRMVLHAGRVIEAGEEITISYTDGLDPTCYGGMDVDPAKDDLDPVSNGSIGKHKERLWEQYRIVCERGCACNGPLTKLRASKRLETQMFRMAMANDVEGMLAKGMERVRLHSDDALRVRFRVRQQLLAQAGSMGIILEGLKLYEIARALTRPDSEEAGTFRN